MTSAGMARETGRVIAGWDHVAQSIGVILSTPIFTRVMRRRFGSGLSDLVDAPMNDRALLAAYVAVAEALEPRIVEGRQYGEPRFALTGVRVMRAEGSGVVGFEVSGIWYPRGHLGDFSAGERRSAIVEDGR